MADLDKIARAFRLFNEKAEKLQRLSFLEKLSHPESGVTTSFERTEPGGGGIVRQERRGPDEESIDAFLLTFRFYRQDNENTSLRNMEKFYQEAPIDQTLKDEFTTLRQQVNEYLDQEINVNFNNEKLTRRRVLDVFLYGGLGHGNEEKRRVYKTWMNSILASFLENEFVFTLGMLHVAIAKFKIINEKALKFLPGPS